MRRVAKVSNAYERAGGCGRVFRCLVLILAALITVALAIVAVVLLVSWNGYGPRYHYKGYWWEKAPTWDSWKHENGATNSSSSENRADCQPFTSPIVYETDVMGQVICPDLSQKTDSEREYLGDQRTSEFVYVGNSAPKYWRETPSAGAPSIKDARKALFSSGSRDASEARNGTAGVSALAAAWGMFLANDLSKASPESSSQEGTVKNLATWRVDGSNVYGSDPGVERSLRSTMEKENGSVASPYLSYSRKYGASWGSLAPLETLSTVDSREIANPYVAALHSLFVREHNRIAGSLLRNHPTMDTEDVYDISRAAVVAEIQEITYAYWARDVLGEGSLGDPCLSKYGDRDGWVTLEAAVSLSAVAHSMMPGEVLLNDKRNPSNSTQGARKRLKISRSYSEAEMGELLSKNALEDILYGAANTPAETVDLSLYALGYDEKTDVVNSSSSSSSSALITPSTASGPCLGADDFACARRLGSKDYGSTRWYQGLSPLSEWSDVTDQEGVSSWKLDLVYGSPSDGSCYQTDLAAAILSEATVQGCQVGPTSHRLLVEQLIRSRDCDPSFYLWNRFLREEEEVGYHALHGLDSIIDANTDAKLAERKQKVPKSRRSVGVDGPQEDQKPHKPKESPNAPRDLFLIS